MVVTAGRGIPLPPWAGGSLTYAVESSTLALIRPGLRPAHLPPQGKALAYPVWLTVEKYRSNNLNIPK